MTRLPLLAALTLSLATPALADPCRLISDNGKAPAWLKPGVTFSGPVVHLVDGDGLCVGLGPSPDQWLEVRLADFNAPELAEPGGPEAKAALSRLTMDRTLRCTAKNRTYDRMAAWCTLDGRPVGDLLRQAGVKEGGRGK